MIARVQKDFILKDLKKKMVFLVGPRQVGKTYLSKEIMKSFKKPLYLNYDQSQDRAFIEKQSWHPEVDLLVFDEVQKMSQWKNHIKGIFDTKRKGLSILVTGSARLNALSKTGDSLAGRYFTHTLLPFSPGELKKVQANKDFSHLYERGGFPEPLTASSLKEAQRWRDQYTQALLRGDLLDLAPIHNHKKMSHLLEILKESTGSLLSLEKIAQKTKLAHGTVEKYIGLLEELYLIFKITPFSKNISRSLLKSPKVYFYDGGLVDDKGARLENLVALCLFKHCQFLNETKADKLSLHFVRNKEKQEIDFCIAKNKKLKLLIEVKTKSTEVSKFLVNLSKEHKVDAKQLILELDRQSSQQGVLIEKLTGFLESLEI